MKKRAGLKIKQQIFNDGFSHFQTVGWVGGGGGATNLTFSAAENILQKSILDYNREAKP